MGRLRGGLAHAYNHLLLDSEEYLDFIDHMSIDGVEMIDGVSAGARLYIELDLFSHASWRDYFELFSATLDLGIFTVHVNPEAVEFRDRFPEKWAAILRKGHAETDLLASSITVLGFFE